MGVLSLQLRDLQAVRLLGIMYLAVVITFGVGLFEALDRDRNGQFPVVYRGCWAAG